MGKAHPLFFSRYANLSRLRPSNCESVWRQKENGIPKSACTRFLCIVTLGNYYWSRSPNMGREMQYLQNSKSMTTSKWRKYLCLQVQSINTTISVKLLETKINGTVSWKYIKQNMTGDSIKGWGFCRKYKWLMVCIMGNSLKRWNFKEGWDVIHLTEEAKLFLLQRWDLKQSIFNLVWIS